MGRKKKSPRNSTARVVTVHEYQRGWDVEPEEPLADCAYIKTTYLLLAPQVIVKCHSMMTLAGDDEWLGYLAISKEETEDQLIYTAHDILIPWQEASGTSVDVIAFPSTDNENLRRVTNGQVYLGGVVHSHHNMDIKFSGTDHEYINQNSEVSLLLANSFGFHAEAITTTLCGKKAKTEIQVIPFTKDKIAVFRAIENDFRDRIRNVSEVSGHTDGWKYVYPSERRTAMPITDVISLVGPNGVTEVIELTGGEIDDNGDATGTDKQPTDQGAETVAGVSD